MPPPDPAVAGLAPRTRAARTIRAWISSGRLVHGERLPAELALAATLGIARGTVRQALRQLVEQRVVVHHPNRGYVVAADPVPPDGLLTRTVVMVGYEARTPQLSAGYEEAVPAAVAASVRGAGLDLLTLHPDRLVITNARTIAKQGPHGVVVLHELSTQADARHFLCELAAAGIPVAAVGWSGDVPTHDQVAPDHEQGGYALARVLIAAGRRRLRLVRTFADDLPWYRRRAAGVARALREAGLPVLPDLCVEVPPRRVDADPDHFLHRTHIYAAHLRQAFADDDPVDGLLMITDGDVPPAIAGARRCGRQPGREFDIVGYDGYWPGVWERALEPTPPMATVDKGNRDLGAALVRMVGERRAGYAGPPRQLLLAPRVVGAGELMVARSG